MGSTPTLQRTRSVTPFGMRNSGRRGSRVPWVLAVAVSLALAGCPQVREPAVDFTLTDQDNIEHSLSDYLGSVVWIQFLNVTTAASQLEAEESMPFFYDELGPEGLVILAVLVGENDDDDPVGLSDCVIWANTYDLTYPVMWNSPAEGGPWADYRVARANGNYYLPLNVFVDRAGQVAYTSGPAEGYSTGGGNYGNVVRSLLAESP